MDVPFTEVCDVLIDEQLSRQDAGQRHVVLDANRLALAELLNQLRNRLRMEQAVGADAFRCQELVDVLGPLLVKEALAVGRPVGLLRAPAYGGRDETIRTALEEMLLVQYFHLQRRREAGREF